MDHTHTPDNHGASSAAGGTLSDPDLAHSIAVGYEPHDISLRGLFIFLASLAMVTVLVLIVVWAGMMGFVKFDRLGDPIASPLTIKADVPIEPLQPSWNHNTMDREDMAAMRDETQKILSSTGISPTGRHYIDIQSAMAKVLPDLPVRSGGGAK